MKFHFVHEWVEMCYALNLSSMRQTMRYTQAYIMRQMVIGLAAIMCQTERQRLTDSMNVYTFTSLAQKDDYFNILLSLQGVPKTAPQYNYYNFTKYFPQNLFQKCTWVC